MAYIFSIRNNIWIIINIIIFSVFIMWQFIMGFGAGIYIGTKYDCKPSIDFIKDCIKKSIPEEAIPKEKDDK